MSVERSLTRFISTMATAAWDLLPRWGRWLSAIVLLLLLGWTFLLQERHGGASIVVHSVIDRPISYVYVNGKMGSNTFAFDGLNAGGGSAGPYRIDGDTVKIDWELDMTEEQEKAGYQFEKHSLTLPMPRREKGHDNFHVLFLPDNKVIVRWGGWAEPVMNEVIDNYRTRKGR
ncbi:TPA: hypothetical protein RQN60_002953 [Aeromonas dhakensis]|nr:hypothetical protein [Aeromonas dhakensis]